MFISYQNWLRRWLYESDFSFKHIDVLNKLKCFWINDHHVSFWCSNKYQRTIIRSIQHRSMINGSQNHVFSWQWNIIKHQFIILNLPKSQWVNSTCSKHIFHDCNIIDWSFVTMLTYDSSFLNIPNNYTLFWMNSDWNEIFWIISKSEMRDTFIMESKSYLLIKLILENFKNDNFCINVCVLRSMGNS